MTAPSVDPRDAVLVDFGGVMTTSVLDAFRAFGATFGYPDLPITLLSTDEIARKLLADHESGRIDADAFDNGFAERLRAHGADVDPGALSARMQSALARDEATIELIQGIRAAGVPVALVSNAFGRDCYAGFDLTALADVVVISSEVGIRKPSRRIYQIACDGLGVQPNRAVMIDDLRQNLDGAARLGIAGVLHTSAEDTGRQLAERFRIG
ncbi:HAD family hydrolase [Nocardia bhagyanarayanae]|uniref:Putative hydrolase of the HAD superfamily n=1 Tax=Nocardia bhagyanarayanae TaxID=1215925 RepID=A0A543EV51_9NOCA|nr:HAD family phosphatase [Nocardia bhagyanarayanae]TQM25456.1 putative hydrolase of the HAD superfamily [Nocardia bhagyanarayanae]